MLWIVGEGKKAISFPDANWTIFELNNLPESLFKSFGPNRNWNAIAVFESAVLESITCLSSFFLSDFIDVTRPVCLTSVTRAERLAQGSMLAVNEASLLHLCLQINKEKIDDF